MTPDLLAPRPCAECGETYTPTSRRQKYCQQKCSTRVKNRKSRDKMLAERGPLIRVCPGCLQTFEGGQAHKVYCSDACRCRETRQRKRATEAERRVYEVKTLREKVQEYVSCGAIKEEAAPLGLAEPEATIPEMIEELSDGVLLRLLKQARRNPYAGLERLEEVA